jgi:hypothetical protein
MVKREDQTEHQTGDLKRKFSRRITREKNIHYWEKISMDVHSRAEEEA